MKRTFPPSSMRAWQYSSTAGGLEKNLKLNTSAPVPKAKPDQTLIQIIYTALNPIDYKPAEIPYLGSLLVPKLATPGIDFAGCVVTPAHGSGLKPGQLVFGVSGTRPTAGGALAEFNVCGTDHAVPIPADIRPIDAATVGVAGLTAYQTIVRHVKNGDRIFINGGSGGCGVFGIQIAKAVGCHVTTTCSTRNVDLCKSLGADVVIDYTKQDVLDALKSAGHQFDHAVDNVGLNTELYWGAHEYLRPDARFIMVGGKPTLDRFADGLKRKVLPSFLGGMQRKTEGFWAKPSVADLTQISKWMQEGKVRTVIDEVFPFEQAPKAIEKLKTDRARGKIVVDVASETYKAAWEKQ